VIKPRSGLYGICIACCRSSWWKSFIQTIRSWLRLRETGYVIPWS